jgi:hypothetical protein
MSYQDIIRELNQVKVNANKLSVQIGASANVLKRQSYDIAATLRGTPSGERAAQRVAKAAEGLEKASGRLTVLYQEIGNYVQRSR